MAATANDLTKKTREELEALAEREGIQGPYSQYATKADLVAAIANADGDATAAAPEPDSVAGDERDAVLAEFHESGVVRAGFVVNYTWPDPVRRAGA